MRANSIYHERQQQKNKATAQVTIFSRFRDPHCVYCHDVRSNQTMEPPTASIASLAPAVATTPVNLTAFVRLPDLITLTVLA